MLFKEYKNKVSHSFSGNFSGNRKLIILVENKYINFIYDTCSENRCKRKFCLLSSLFLQILSSLTVNHKVSEVL